MFINGSLIDDADAVIARIEEASLFRKLVDCVIDQAGLEYGIARAKLVAAWMSDQVKSSLAGLKKAAEHQKIVLAAQKEFAQLVDGQVEVVGPHLQQLDTIYHKHHQ
jgi:enoyl-[acyl-carrier-protein] reductase (NADH)